MGLVNAAAALALDLLGANEPDLLLLLFDAFCGFASGVLAAMVASIILPLFEWLFEITTNIKLLELSNLNLPLLKQLAERAPGTYHHSIMVGLLAESAAEAIGGDALFARVACYYHDIGKMVRPTYFVENQTYRENRHDSLSPKMSSIVLANHVKQGIELAKQYKLPPRIISIIPQHHGTGLMKFFYYKARQAEDGNDSAALEREFRYPGPKPQSKEAAIIMIADSVEAAARTVQDPTPTKLRNMIDMIITRIRDDGQLDECDITLRELKLVSDSFVKVVMGIHHHRIAYPGYDFNRAGTQAVLSQITPAARSRRRLPSSPPCRKPRPSKAPGPAISEKRVAIEVVNKQRLVSVDRGRICDLATRTLDSIGRADSSLTVAFVRDPRIRELNLRFRGKPHATDVLSFPGERATILRPDYLGDIVISADTAARQAEEAGHSVEREVSELVIHGVLHLCGYDHETDQGEMNRLELKLRRKLLFKSWRDAIMAEC